MIKEVRIYIDEDMDKFMSGVLVCGSIVSINEDSTCTQHDELIDKKEYHSAEELIEDIASKLNVDPSIVEIDS